MNDVVPHTDPARVEANGIELVYDTFGDLRTRPRSCWSWGSAPR